MNKNNSNNLQNDITAIILTYNEEKHIERCILSIKEVVKKIIVIDSFSNDDTVYIAQKNNAQILKNNFINQSKQINWALENIKFSTRWILRIDADEILTNGLKDKIIQKINNIHQQISGISFNRKIRFLNKDINFGGVSPHKTLRIWKAGEGRCEDAWMDEQIVVNGKVQHLNEYLIDSNLNSFSWWLQKHKRYAIREAINFLLIQKNLKSLRQPKDQSKINKYYKLKIYYKLPIFIRPFLLFIYNYIFKFGFLSSWQGLIFYFFQVIWFRLMVDMNIHQIEKIIKRQKFSLAEAIKVKYGYEQI
ncbi:MAG: glycosyltransferase family 2 protein [Candidatus Pelagibacter sp.]|mgnify:CR=1 FL=1|tara:strand:+ start:5862 stop:6776 length:915 start_codon:yes stop_codon:yes gene_type:complete